MVVDDPAVHESGHLQTLVRPLGRLFDLLVNLVDQGHRNLHPLRDQAAGYALKDEQDDWHYLGFIAPYLQKFSLRYVLVVAVHLERVDGLGVLGLLVVYELLVDLVVGHLVVVEQDQEPGRGADPREVDE